MTESLPDIDGGKAKAKGKGKKAKSRGKSPGKTPVRKINDYVIEGGEVNDKEQTIALKALIDSIKNKMMREAQQIIEGGGDPSDLYNPDTLIFAGKKNRKRPQLHK